MCDQNGQMHKINVKLTFRIPKNSILMSVDSLLDAIRVTFASMATRKEEEDDETKIIDKRKRVPFN